MPEVRHQERLQGEGAYENLPYLPPKHSTLYKTRVEMIKLKFISLQIMHVKIGFYCEMGGQLI